MSDKPKLCRDCKWYDEKEDELHDECLHDAARYGGGINARVFVRGPVVEAPVLRHGCGAMRAGICGAEARWFEPREE